MAQWFVTSNDVVQGPFSTDEVKSRIQSGTFGESHLIWGRSMTDWRPPSRWLKDLTGLLEKMNSDQDFRHWHYSYEGQSYGPMNRDQLLHSIKGVKRPSDVLVWTKGMKAWAPLYEFHDLMDDVGVNKRQFPRAQINGKITVRWDEKTSIGTWETISEGGCGGTGFADLVPGMTVTVDLESKMLFEPLKLKAEVRYVRDNGYVGFRFQKLSMEARGAIIQYIKNQSAVTEETQVA